MSHPQSITGAVSSRLKVYLLRYSFDTFCWNIKNILLPVHFCWKMQKRFCLNIRLLHSATPADYLCHSCWMHWAWRNSDPTFESRDINFNFHVSLLLKISWVRLLLRFVPSNLNTENFKDDQSRSRIHNVPIERGGLVNIWHYLSFP